MDKQDLIKEIMGKKEYRPLTKKELLKKVYRHGKGQEDGETVLKEMENKGEIVKNQSGRYGLPGPMGFVVGELELNPKGFGFLLPDEEGRQDVYIDGEKMGSAMHGDRVLVRLLSSQSTDMRREKRAEGEVVRIIRRSDPVIVGIFQRTQNYGFVIPDSPKVLEHILIPEGKTSKAKDGQKVAVKIETWPKEQRLPAGIVINVLGQPGEEEAEREAVVLKHGLKKDFSKESLHEAEKLEENIGNEMGQREDLRDLFTVTIDDAEAKDLDDAVSLERIDEDKVRLGVHIADVSFYVKKGSALDLEAGERGTSVYLIDRVIPMLPPRLSNHLCSLNADEDKLAVTVFMDLDSSGNLLSYRIAESMIRIDHRLTYEYTSRLISGDITIENEAEKKIHDLVVFLEEVSMGLRKKRFAAGSIDFDFPEAKIELDEQGQVLNVRRAERYTAHWIIEECMLAANQTVAEHIQRKQMPGLFRIHEAPNEEAVEHLRNFLPTLGYRLRGKKKLTPKSLQKVLKASSKRGMEPLVGRVILQAMERARYSIENTGHFGLAFKNYTHFTSPIRRYPDLMVHRLLKEANTEETHRKKDKVHLKQLREAAVASSAAERKAAEAEYEWVDRKKMEFLGGQLGEIFEGMISSVTNFGLFVQLENTIEGLVHISNMNDDYYTFDEKHYLLKGRRTKKSYQLGDRVEVQVVKVDVSSTQADFILVDASEKV